MKKKIQIKNLNVSFSTQRALRNISFDVYEHEILAIIGPAKSGKTTLLRVLNRFLDFDPQVEITGEVLVDGKNIYRDNSQTLNLRKKIGMIFAVPVPLPMSIFDNLAYGPRLHGKTNQIDLNKIAKNCLEAAGLWQEVKDRLHLPASKLSGGQQQRLCLSRSLTISPEIILLDEPCSGLDPISTAYVEKTMIKLKNRYTLILVTNNSKQAARVADRTAFFLSGSLVEIGKTGRIFTAPADARTNDYLTGRFG